MLAAQPVDVSPSAEVSALVKALAFGVVAATLEPFV